VPLVVGVGLLVPFALWERRATDPVVAFPLFRSTHYSAGVVLIAVQNLVMYALLFQVPLVAVALFHLESRDTGRLLVSMMLAMVITSPVAGRLTDHVGARFMAVAGSVVSLLGIVALASVHLTGPGQLTLPLVLLGVGLGLSTPAAQTASMTAVSAELSGMAAGVSSTMRYLGGIVGVAVMSLTLDVHGTRSEVVSEHRELMVFFAGALAVGLVCAALLPGRPRPSETVHDPVVPGGAISS
jgi:MFS family permease